MNKQILWTLGLILSVCILQTACGHKGPPQPPQEMVAAPQHESFDSGYFT